MQRRKLANPREYKRMPKKASIGKKRKQIDRTSILWGGDLPESERTEVD